MSTTEIFPISWGGTRQRGGDWTKGFTVIFNLPLLQLILEWLVNGCIIGWRYFVSPQGTILIYVLYHLILSFTIVDWCIHPSLALCPSSIQNESISSKPLWSTFHYCHIIPCLSLEISKYLFILYLGILCSFLSQLYHLVDL